MKNNLALIKSRGNLPPPLPQFLHTETKLIAENDPDYIYYDVLITNLQSTTTPPPAGSPPPQQKDVVGGLLDKFFKKPKN